MSFKNRFRGGDRSPFGRRGGRGAGPADRGGTAREGFRHGGLRMRASRRVHAADLHLAILALLEEKPRHGYDLIKAIGELSGGAYAPSPGMVYPALAYLEETDQVEAGASDGAKKQYRLTAAGKAALAAGRERADALLGQFRAFAREIAALDGERPAAAEAVPAAAQEFEAARRELKAALFDGMDAPPAEQQRIAAILRRAVSEITRR